MWDKELFQNFRFMGEVGCIAASVGARMRMAGGVADADAGGVAEVRGLSA